MSSIYMTIVGDNFYQGELFFYLARNHMRAPMLEGNGEQSNAIFARNIRFCRAGKPKQSNPSYTHILDCFTLRVRNDDQNERISSNLLC